MQPKSLNPYSPQKFNEFCQIFFFFFHSQISFSSLSSVEFSIYFQQTASTNHL